MVCSEMILWQKHFDQKTTWFLKQALIPLVGDKKLFYSTQEHNYNTRNNCHTQLLQKNQPRLTLSLYGLGFNSLCFEMFWDVLQLMLDLQLITKPNTSSLSPFNEITIGEEDIATLGFLLSTRVSLTKEAGTQKFSYKIYILFRYLFENFYQFLFIKLMCYTHYIC